MSIYNCVYVLLYLFVLWKISQKIKTNSYCVGGKHRSSTKNITGENTFLNKKTGKEINILFGKCEVCNRKKSMIVSDNTIEAEGLGSFFQKFGIDFC